MDETEGQVFFLASGDPVRPYDIHLFRTNLDAKRTQRLTKEDDHHDIRFSPSKKYYVDNHSSPQRPPVAELRSSDGTLIRPISSANEAVLSQLNWRPPEDVHVKAADGETDLFGLLFKPFDFDPEKQYPLIDLIYNGASQETLSSYIHPHGFDFHSDHARALAQLGFLVLVLDGRGTSGRGKHFQDFCYGSVGRNEIPDHAAAIRQLSDARPYVDVDRVGIFGRSAGGYMTIRAMLTEPDLFSVGVASAATAFVRTTACMGPFEENREAYEYGSTLPLAGNLEGELLLIHGTGDGNAPFSYAMKMVDALIRNQKRFDLIVLPGETHYYTDSAKSYVRGAVREYFERRLLR